MTQLSLFEDAPRFYHRALECLGRLELEECRRELEFHRRHFPHGADPEPVAVAAAWLETRLPPEDAGPECSGERAFAVCRALREGKGGGDPRKIGLPDGGRGRPHPGGEGGLDVGADRGESA